MPSAFWKIRSGFQSLFLREEGQDLVEYALVLFLISISAVATLTSLAAKVTAIFTSVTGKL
ncbi:MAG: Flp family type IVb pilin [Terracidiphilus sp.]|jgi:Flp pilus assembly pilin Flp